MSQQEKNFQIFQRLQDSGRIAHAYLFDGPDFHALNDFTNDLAQWMHCDDPLSTQPYFCGKCSACIKVKSGNHPDVIQIDSGDSDTIKIAQVRELMDRIRLRPFYGKQKIFLIHKVDAMTKDAANSLLKTLEEPHSDNLFLLTTSQPENLLDTIRSRCQTMRFYPESQETLASFLTAEYHEKSLSAQVLAFFADGSSQKAKHLFESKFLDQKNRWLDDFVFNRNSEDFIKKISSQKDDLKLFLKAMMFWMRDSLVYKSSGSSQKLAHADRSADVTQFAENRSFDQLKELYQQCVHAYQMVVQNLNVKVSLSIMKESLWVK